MESVEKVVMTEKPSDHFVLVHGACHGGWCWYKVRCVLESSGCTVTCVDLKSSGVDLTDADVISSFDDYNYPLLHLLSSLPDHQKVILVGHSAGGVSVTEATHKFADKIRAAVYVGASMLKLGFSSPQDLLDGAPDLSKYGDVYEYGYGLGRDQPPTSFTFKKEIQRKIFYQMSPLEDCTLASMLLRPSPIRAFYETKFTEGKDSDKVPRVYIKTVHDLVLTQDQQDAMIKRWPPSDVYTIDSDHSPFFSNPFQFSGLLVNVAAKYP